jgi:tRNA-modifying protein YgfZ
MPDEDIFTMIEQWKQFLRDTGAQFAEQEIAYFTSSGDFTDWNTGFVAPLLQLGVIVAEGADAADFLHKQLSNDVNHLTTDTARLAGYCSPKGRLLSTLLMWREVNQTRDQTRDQSGDQIYLQLPVALLPAILKRLRMFVLRAKATLRDASDETVLLGLGGAQAASVLGHWFAQLPDAPYGTVHNEYGCLIRVADAFGAARFEWRLNSALAQQIWPKLTQQLPPVASRVWGLSEIAAGVPQVLAATQEKFVPQMINFELIGGVNFKKGCYPGQEIVARSQYLGKLKRRMHAARIRSEQVVQAGDEVFSPDDPEQACGMVVNAERAADGAFACLIEIKIALLTSSVRHRSPDGPICEFGPLPYALDGLE